MARTRFLAAGTTVALFAALAAAIQLSANAQSPPRKLPPAAANRAHHHDAFAVCAEECSACQLACDSCAAHCAALLAGGDREHKPTLASCQDCADVCSAAARIVARGGPYAADICKACAAVCKQCAEKCERFPDDKHMQQCAEECHKCQKACEEMLKHAPQDEKK